jgi:hypothetical protein
VVGMGELWSEVIRRSRVQSPPFSIILTSVVKIKLLNKNARSPFQSFKAIRKIKRFFYLLTSKGEKNT